VLAVLSSSCEGSYITESSMTGFLAGWDLGFNGVFSASAIQPGAADEGYGPAAYAVILTFEKWADGTPVRDPTPGIRFSLSEDGVLSWGGGCGSSARSLAARYPNYLIPPPPLPAPPPGTPRTGNAAVDEVVDAVVTRDVLTLQERTKTIQVGCGTDRWLPRCPLSKPAGTLVPAVIREGCDERTWGEPFRLAEDYDSRLGPNPTIVAIAKGDGADGVAYWIVFDGAPIPDPPRNEFGRALGVTEAGEIAVINGGCSQSAQKLAATFDDFVVPPK
jgi:hypothetical protein